MTISSSSSPVVGVVTVLITRTGFDVFSEIFGSRTSYGCRSSRFPHFKFGPTGFGVINNTSTSHTYAYQTFDAHVCRTPRDIRFASVN